MKLRLTALSTLAIAAALSAVPGLCVAAPTDSEVQSITAARVEYVSAKRSIDREDYDTALGALKSAERLDPKSADVQNMLGFTYRQKGDLDRAIQHYNRALELNPYHRGAHEYLGRVYLMMGKPEKAKALLANLERVCTDKCPERDSLKLAIDEWDPWKNPARAARSY